MKTQDTARLVDSAIAAQKQAYCPYSHYAVGAAVMTKSGSIFTGCNIENPSQNLGLCAERLAVFNAVAGGAKEIAAVAVACSKPSPCGACRQILFEFSAKNAPCNLIDLNAKTGRRKITRTSVRALLPAAYDPRALGLLTRREKS